MRLPSPASCEFQLSQPTTNTQLDKQKRLPSRKTAVAVDKTTTIAAILVSYPLLGQAARLPVDLPNSREIWYGCGQEQ